MSGRQVVQLACAKDQRAFVVIGRPYTAYDPAVNLDTGKKIQVPFEQTLIIATNLEPKDLADPAFAGAIR